MSKLTFGEVITIVIKNILEAGELYFSNVGKRTVMSLAKAKELAIADFEYLLSKEGNFMKAVDAGDGVFTVEPYADGAAVNVDDDVAVIARIATKANDRFIQFFATQQKVLLAPGDELTLTVRSGAEASHYLALAVDGEITVEVQE